MMNSLLIRNLNYCSIVVSCHHRCHTRPNGDGMHLFAAPVYRSRVLRSCLLSLTPLQHKGDEPFRAPHIFLILQAQMLLEDVLFHMDTVALANQRTSHKDQQTQPVGIVESKSEQRDEHAVSRGMTAQRPTGACPGTRPGSCPR